MEHTDTRVELCWTIYTHSHTYTYTNMYVYGWRASAVVRSRGTAAARCRRVICALYRFAGWFG